MAMRDEVIEAAKSFYKDAISQCDFDERFGLYDFMADFTLSREAELRRQIADRLDEILGGGWVDGSPSATRSRINTYIKELRGNK